MRKSRLFGLSASVNTVESNGLNSNEKFLSQQKDRFDELVAAKVKKQTTIVESNFAIELTKQKASLDARFNAELEKQKLINERLEKLILSASNQLNENLANELLNLKEIAVTLVMQSLYKIATKEVFKQEVIVHVVDLLIEKINSENLTSLNISEADYKLIESLESYDKIKSFVHIDNTLSAGQMTLGGTGSFFKVGLTDRLDSLRHAFSVALEQESEL
jgi:hypothetical protein